MERFQDDALVVFGHVHRDKLVGGQKTEAQVADALKEPGGVEQEGRMEMFVGQFRPFEFPGHLGGIGIEQRGGLFAPKQQQAGAGDAAPEGEPGFVEKGGVIPGADGGFRDAFVVLGGKDGARFRQCFGIKIGNGRLFDNDGRPVIRQPLRANFILLGDAQTREA